MLRGVSAGTGPVSVSPAEAPRPSAIARRRPNLNVSCIPAPPAPGEPCMRARFAAVRPRPLSQSDRAEPGPSQGGASGPTRCCQRLVNRSHMVRLARPGALWALHTGCYRGAGKCSLKTAFRRAGARHSNWEADCWERLRSACSPPRSAAASRARLALPSKRRSAPGRQGSQARRFLSAWECPRTGTYAVPGEDELKGYELAFEHLNSRRRADEADRARK